MWDQQILNKNSPLPIELHSRFSMATLEIVNGKALVVLLGLSDGLAKDYDRVKDDLQV